MEKQSRPAEPGTVTAVRDYTHDVPKKLAALIAATLISLGLTAPVTAHAQLSSSGSSSGSSTGSAPSRPMPLQVGERDALVTLPANYDPTRAYPVLLAFGGWNVSPESLAADHGRELGRDAIVAYGRGVGDAWAGAPYAATSITEDVAYARMIVDALDAQYAIDRSSVHALGHSNGGAFTLVLACHAPDLVNGVVSIAGMFYDPVDAGCLAAGEPVLFLHGANDGIAAPAGGIRNGAHFLPLETVVGNWAQRNSCDSQQVVGERHTYLGCTAATELIYSPDSGHGWPGHTTRTAWDFLSRL